MRTRPKNIIKGVGWECTGKAGRNLMLYRTEYLMCKLKICAAVPTLQAQCTNKKKCTQIKDIKMEEQGREWKGSMKRGEAAKEAKAQIIPPL